MSNMLRLSEEEVARMKATVDKLLLRHMAAVQCPLTPHQLAKLYEAAMSPIERVTWNNARQWWIETIDRPPFKRKEMAGVPLLLPYGERVILQLSANTLESEQYPMWSCTDPIDVQSPIDTPYVLGDAARELHTWAHEAIKVHSMAQRTYNMAYTLFSMASTVGQLHRMCPDLVRYTYDETREALERQQRRSPRPAGWDKIDRRVLRLSMDHLALCYLLPIQGEADSVYEFCNTQDWLFCRGTARAAHGDVFPGNQLLDHVSCYDLDAEMFK